MKTTNYTDSRLIAAAIVALLATAAAGSVAMVRQTEAAATDRQSIPTLGRIVVTPSSARFVSAQGEVAALTSPGNSNTIGKCDDDSLNRAYVLDQGRNPDLRTSPEISGA